MSRHAFSSGAAALAAAVFLALLAACSRESSTPTHRPATAANVAPKPEAAAEGQFTASLPLTGGPAGYVGADNCRSCHEDQYKSWHRTYHRTMTTLASEETVKANFHGVVLTNDTTRFTLSKTNDQFWVRMERTTPVKPGEPPREPYDVRIGLLTGSHHMQVFWVPGGSGNMQVGFPFTWLIPEKRWVPRHLTFIRPPDAEHRSEVWNVVCSRCHATGMEPGVDNVSRTMLSRAGELGISCEACHGPGEKHANARLAERDKARVVDSATLRKEIVHPEKIDPVRASQVCGFCHSMKWFDKSEDWRRAGFHYRPGDDLEATTPIIQPDKVDKIPGLSDYLAKNPELLLSYFWPDGMMRVSGREYNGLLSSPCYKGGKFSCLSCHSMHESDPNALVAKGRDGNAACTPCHENFRDKAKLTAHTGHRDGSSGSECYNCHMPFTTYGVLKAIRSHQVSSPRVADQLATGRPNACNLCHLDKPLAWTAKQLADRYRHAVPQLSEDQTRVAESVRLALAGDAGQRALIAWHLGWPAAIQTSGKDWIPPILGTLLDDPYAAVRCIAERSLKQSSIPLPAGYDYTVSPEARPPIHTQIVAQWKNSTPTGRTIPQETLANPADTTAMETRFQSLLQQRDPKKLRLRE